MQSGAQCFSGASDGEARGAIPTAVSVVERRGELLWGAEDATPVRSDAHLPANGNVDGHQLHVLQHRLQADDPTRLFAAVLAHRFRRVLKVKCTGFSIPHHVISRYISSIISVVGLNAIE